MAGNTLYYGDNLDPPFNSKATYNVLFGEQNGSKAAAQAYQQVVEGGGKVGYHGQGEIEVGDARDDGCCCLARLNRS